MSRRATSHLEETRSRRQNSTFDFLKERERRLELKARMSQTVAPVRTRFRPENAKLFMANQVLGGFGNDSPKWTIGASRRPDIVTDPTPDPAQYNIPEVGINTSRAFSIGQRTGPEYGVRHTAATPESFKTMRPRVFPESRPIHIGERPPDTQPFVSPGPSYYPPPMGGGLGPVIGEKHPEDGREGTPGPGQYSPEYPATHSAPAYTVPRSGHGQSFVDEYKNDYPGPGAYNIEKPLMRAPKWTNRRREKSKRFRKMWEERDRPWNPKRENVHG